MAYRTPHVVVPFCNLYLPILLLIKLLLYAIDLDQDVVLLLLLEPLANIMTGSFLFLPKMQQILSLQIFLL
jgi:hypothetical protein